MIYNPIDGICLIVLRAATLLKGKKFGNKLYSRIYSIIEGRYLKTGVK